MTRWPWRRVTYTIPMAPNGLDDPHDPRAPRDLRGRRVVLMGLGRFGGGVGAARFLARCGARVLVTDQADEAALASSIAQLADLPGIEYRLGTHLEADFTAAELIVASPAIKPGHPCLQAARAVGVPITSEIRLLAQRLPDRRRVIGVTGTAGKSTVTAMIGHVLKKVAEDGGPIADGTGLPPSAIAHPPTVWIGGNIGGSLLPRLEDIQPRDWIVLELSSFMLEGLRQDRWSPHVAVLTNFMPNHLDWHGNLEAYRRAKQAIFEFQRHADGDVAITGPGVSETFAPATPAVTDSRMVVAGDDADTAQGVGRLDLRLPGEHNQLNARLALAAVEAALGIPAAQAAATLGDFTGLPHRLQLVAEHASVRYYNDSKSTTPDAGRLAIDSFPPGTAHLILGGSDKGSDLTPLAHHAARRCRALYTIGQTGPAIAEAARHADSCEAEIVPCGDLDTAMEAIARRLRRGEAVVLSPGCASYDQYANYEQRGQRFIEAVLRWTSETGLIPRA